MKTISRNEAVELITQHEFMLIPEERRLDHVLNFWGLDENDKEFHELSIEMKKELINNEEPSLDINHTMYDELIMLDLKHKYIGVTNEFLTNEANRLGLGKYNVFGDIEILSPCPCCLFKTIEKSGNFDICPLCQWEDNGITEDDEYSGANHTTLGEARELFFKNVKKESLKKWSK